MAAGLVTVNFKDASGATLTGRFWSSDGTTAGLLYPAPVLVDQNANTFSQANPLAVTTPVQYVDVTLTLDTTTYGAGDLIADTQVVAGAVRSNDALGLLQSVTVIDEDDQGAAFDIFLLNANVSLGTENVAPSITDANSRNLLGYVSVAASDYKDLGGMRIATKTGIGLVVKPASGTSDVYVAVVSNASAPTYTATGVRLRLGFLS